MLHARRTEKGQYLTPGDSVVASFSRRLMSLWLSLLPIAYLHVVFIDDASGAGRETEAAAAQYNRRLELGRSIGDVVIEPESAIWMIGQVGDDIASADIDQTVLHELRLDKKI